MDSDKHTRSTCGVLDLRQQLVRRCVWQWTVAGGRRRWFVGADRADVDGLLVPIGWRRGFGAAPALMVPRRRGATNTTLAATQRHPCRSGMVTADCTRSRSRPETWWRLAALKDQRKIPAFTISLTPSRARGADDGGRRRRDASYGVARDSHRRKQGDWLTQPPYQAFAQRVSFQRTSTRQQLDCATTLLLRSQVNRRTPISDGLSACS